ncbi:sperm flagellar protein 1 [Drosophila mojavensis]|uniref:sperm flagellar protein 1 n=1 Tax=Drosophila mojavensis TaxID=7230 RepID=UPI001CD09A64|nr:sperm flagellar protein 1 [Drosophila mojavensis]XP_032583801.2 sperm flagellar protein 1 [Drosophila mojavensis]
MMPFNRTLSSEQLQELNKWMSNLQIKLDNRTRRELSDVVNVAQIINNLNSKLVDMCCYKSQSSLALKLENWEIFNHKVLRKLGLKLSHNDLTQLASGSLAALKCLLYYLMTWNRDGLSPVSPSKRISSIGGKKKTTGSLSGSTELAAEQKSNENVQLDMPEVGMSVPYAKYKQVIQESYKKKRYLSSISHKAKYLESLMMVKEDRINFLLERIAALAALANHNAKNCSQAD